MRVDSEALNAWIGRTETRHDVIAPAPVAGLSATLDYGQPVAVMGEPLPPCWHWLYFLDAIAASGLDADGHGKRGGFMPPIPLPRRMWAGSRLQFHAPLKVGDKARRESTIADISHKQGRSGELVFLTLRHHVFAGDTLTIEEEQDLVYRTVGGGGGTSKAPKGRADAQWERGINPDPLLLFRYSALTFNSHRIHYDRDYATGVEGYGSLVVQGPLTATLLLDLCHRELPGARVKAFEFSAVRPLLEGSSLSLCGKPEDDLVELWALDNMGMLAMEARVSLATPE
jgi:3-methylfumaryl-CoA hydratase